MEATKDKAMKPEAGAPGGGVKSLFKRRSKKQATKKKKERSKGKKEAKGRGFPASAGANGKEENSR